jgi:hypothetical protein
MYSAFEVLKSTPRPVYSVEPFAKSRFHFFVGQGAIGSGVLKGEAHLVEDVEMVSDILY